MNNTNKQLGSHTQSMVIDGHRITLGSVAIAVERADTLTVSDAEALEAWLGHAGYRTEWQRIEQRGSVTFLDLQVLR